MNTKTCSREGCKEAAKHKCTKIVYCDKHYVQSTRMRTAKNDNKYVPSVEEFDNLWENLVKNNFKCPVCKQKMVIKTQIGEPKGNVISLQHWNNGDIELICHSCNAKHAHSKLGDNWKNIPKGYKYCPECSNVKLIENFCKSKYMQDGLDGKCRFCRKQYRDKNKDKAKIYRKNNKDKKRVYNKTYQKKNKDKIKAYKEKNKDKIKQKAKIYREKNKNKIRERDKLYREKNKDKKRESAKAYRENNKDKIKAYREKNKEKISIYNKKYREKNKKTKS